MKKKIISFLGLLLVAVSLFIYPNEAKADNFNINYDYQLSTYEGDSRTAYPWYIILHESGNQNDIYDSDAVLHEVQYMKNNYANAYSTFFVGGGGQVYQIGEPGYVAWAALGGNPYSPVQIELARTTDKATFNNDYRTYINLARYYANQYGIPLTLDEGYAGTKGIKTHQWITNNYGGDHQDPYGYLSSWGITYQQLAHDLMYGVDSPQPTVRRDVVTVKNGPATGIAAWNSKGKIVPGSNSTFRNDTSWKTANIKLINGLPMYQVSTNEYIPKKYTDQAGIITINAIAGITAINSKGEEYKGSEKTFTDQSKWLSDDKGVRVINGRLCFQVSTDQYIDAFYTIGGGNM